MANTSAAKKAIRTSSKNRLVNNSRKSRVRTFIRKVSDSIKSGNKETAMKDFKALESEIMKGVSQKIFHINAASRKISRIYAQIKKLGQ